MKITSRRLLGAAAGLLAAGCGGGGSGGSGGGGVDSEANEICHTIATSGSQFSCNGVANNIDDCNKVFDGSLVSYGLLHSVAGGGDIGSGDGDAILTGTAANQQIAGSVAGMYFVAPTTGTLSVSIATLLNGIPQESMAGPYTYTFDTGTDNSCPSGATCEYSTGKDSFIAIETTKPYDAIQATVQLSGLQPVQLHELCVR